MNQRVFCKTNMFAIVALTASAIEVGKMVGFEPERFFPNVRLLTPLHELFSRYQTDGLEIGFIR